MIDRGFFVSLNVDNGKLRKEQKAVNAVLPTNATWHCSGPDLYRVKPSWVEGNLRGVRSHREDLSMSRIMVTKTWNTDCGIFELKRSISFLPCVVPISIPSVFFRPTLTWSCKGGGLERFNRDFYWDFYKQNRFTLRSPSSSPDVTFACAGLVELIRRLFRIFGHAVFYRTRWAWQVVLRSWEMRNATKF